jgi:hypothetical protein
MRRITAAGILCGVNVAAAFSGTVVTLRGSRCASLAAARSVRVIGAAGVDEKQKEEGVFEPHRPVGRRAVLSEAVTAGLVLGAAAPAGAKEGKAKAGAWAKHEGEFTEQELDGFTETKSGLLFKDIEEGTGVVPQPGQKIKAHCNVYVICMHVCMERERERERARAREREKERARAKQTDMPRHTHIHTHTRTDRQRQRDAYAGPCVRACELVHSD